MVNIMLLISLLVMAACLYKSNNTDGRKAPFAISVGLFLIMLGNVLLTVYLLGGHVFDYIDSYGWAISFVGIAILLLGERRHFTRAAES